MRQDVSRIKMDGKLRCIVKHYIGEIGIRENYGDKGQSGFERYIDVIQQQQTSHFR